jgi:uncharacterized protein YbcC (UPF0753/DUF2309 family)
MTERARDAVRARIRALATLAFDAVPATRPIGGFIATNPLAGLERLPFVEAVASMRERTGARGFLPEREYRKRLANGEIARDAFERALANATEANGDTSRTICGNTIARRAALRGSLLGEDYSEPLAAAVRGRLAGMAAHARVSLPPHVLTADIADAHCATAIAALVDERTICWCAAYLDEGQAAWHMPHRERGLYAAWRTLARFDTSAAARAIPAYRERLDAAADRADDAIVDSLARLAITPGDWEAYLTSHVLRLPGWAGLLKTRATMDYLAIRLWYEAALVRGVADRHGVEPTRAALAERFGVPRDETAERFAATALTAACAALGFAAADVWSMDDDDLRWLCDAIAAREPERRGAIWLEAHERSVRDGLLRKLAHRAGDVPAKARVDVTFCIDARSEGLRRHLEALGPYRTRGFAGFFGLPVALRAVDSQWAQQACPVLLTPKHEIVEVHRDEPRRVARAQRGRRVAAHVRRVLHDVKSSVASPYVLFEAIGAVFAVALAGRTLVPAFFGRTRERIARAVAPAARTGLVVAKEADGDEAAGFTHDERVFFAESALSLMGMREDFARLAVFAGHGSSTENNPFEASLDCGACAGNRGGPNARMLATLLNAEDVRDGLAARGIAIPAATFFVAAEHDTATDRVRIFDEHLVPASHRADLEDLRSALGRAGAALAAERLAALSSAHAQSGGAGAVAHVAARSADWAQVRPEWGLARNAAFIIAPRSLSAGIDLERRAFLHEYDAAADTDGTVLEVIMTAPLVVAQWINNHYYFATVDNGRYGSGSKVIHNVVGCVGVMAGNRGDVRSGLPLQSLADDNGWYHEPLRLLAVVAAPRARIDAVVRRNAVLRNLFHNAWIALVAWDAEQGRFWEYRTDGTWHERDAQERNPATNNGAHDGTRVDPHEDVASSRAGRAARSGPRTARARARQRLHGNTERVGHGAPRLP